MENKIKLEQINKTLDKLYNNLPNYTISGFKDCAITITLLERIKNKLEIEVKQDEKHNTLY